MDKQDANRIIKKYSKYDLHTLLTATIKALEDNNIDIEPYVEPSREELKHWRTTI